MKRTFAGTVLAFGRPRADLTGADLRGASFLGADLRTAVLINARIRVTELVGADLRGAIMPDGSMHL